MATPSAHRYTSLKEFYPFYLSEHRDPTCRVLHFTGTSLIVLWVILAVVLRNAMWLLMVPLVGYGFAWAGHYFFEKKHPGHLPVPGLQPGQ